MIARSMRIATAAMIDASTLVALIFPSGAQQRCDNLGRPLKAEVLGLGQALCSVLG